MTEIEPVDNTENPNDIEALATQEAQKLLEQADDVEELILSIGVTPEEVEALRVQQGVDRVNWKKILALSTKETIVQTAAIILSAHIIFLCALGLSYKPDCSTLEFITRAVIAEIGAFLTVAGADFGFNLKRQYNAEADILNREINN
ncbi:hypothetical protein KBC89_02640 [Candidatus Woesebacteria bacterium]|nr:hypothetical protein [Candidatus Woesebacteria bacterium]